MELPFSYPIASASAAARHHPHQQQVLARPSQVLRLESAAWTLLPSGPSGTCASAPPLELLQRRAEHRWVP